jgi:hypothetical protein
MYALHDGIKKYPADGNQKRNKKEDAFQRKLSFLQIL